MKNRKLDIRPFTKQFYKGNVIYFIFALCETLLGAIGALLVSWLVQQLIDLIGGYETGLNLLQLTAITLVLIGGIAVANMISYHSKPKFITRGISQYKEYVFGELTKKNISAFSGENSSTYISALTNDIQTIEQGYLWNTFSMLESLLTFLGSMVLMIWYSPLLTLIAIGLSLFPLIASILTGNKVAAEEKKVSDRNEAYTSTLRDSLGGFSVIKSFKVEAQMICLFKENVRELANAQCGKHKMRILVQMFGEIAGVTAQARRVHLWSVSCPIRQRCYRRYYDDICSVNELCPQPNRHDTHLYRRKKSGKGFGGKNCECLKCQCQRRM